MHELYELLQPSGFDCERLPTISKQNCNPLLQVVAATVLKLPSEMLQRAAPRLW
jgi:hypothetical protein